jgi:hypothetical protein
VFRHVVLLRWAPEATAADQESLAEALGRLPGAIPAIRVYRYGADAGLNDENFDFAVVADFADVAGYEQYRDHPAHRAVVAQHILPIAAERVAVQFRLDD